MVRRITGKQRSLVKSEKSSGKSSITSVAKGIVNATKDAIAIGVNEAKNIIEKTPDYGYRTIDNIALNNRCKYNFMEGLIKDLSIDQFCNFNNRNEVYLRRLMMLNITEHDITVSALGVDAAFKGDGSHITTSAMSPLYVSEINYTDKTTLRWNFNSLKQAIEVLLGLNITNEKKSVKICKRCYKPFLAKNPSADYCSTTCRNVANVYKSRARNKNK